MLDGNAIVLQEIMPESIEQLRCWRNDPELRQYFREWKDITPDQQTKWYRERGNNTDPQHVYFQIMLKDQMALAENDAIKQRQLIGCCGVLNINWRIRTGELSIFLGPAFHGLGLGRETLELLTRYAFEECNLHKFWGECYDSNDAIKLYTGVGFKIDGTIRDSWFHNGKYGGSYIFSILENEWREKYGTI